MADAVRKFDAADAKERATWGRPLATGINAKDIDANPRTVRAAIDRGYLEILSVSTAEGSKLRRGSYGRWKGGADPRATVAMIVRPTLAGRALALLLSAQR